MVLICNFAGFKAPEMVKARPVVVVSPNHLVRPGLVTVVPLSTTPPMPVEPYHYRLRGSPIPGDPIDEVWAKSDMICSVGVHRLDRVK
ncbi:MAG TPA: type II toxin-antitoxin system PemK/MazF family toxin, partial [Rudaea sp.]|nr:type II toxin-antitoxin system PemK/MazF family toxin [Rudaea sp.]